MVGLVNKAHHLLLHLVVLAPAVRHLLVITQVVVEELLAHRGLLVLEERVGEEMQIKGILALQLTGLQILAVEEVEQELHLNQAPPAAPVS